MPDDVPHRAVYAPIFAAASVLCLVFVLVFYAILGYETHQAVCVLQERRLAEQADSRAFLQMTLAERVAKYGALGNIPESTIRVGIARNQEWINAMDGLHCSIP